MESRDELEDRGQAEGVVGGSGSGVLSCPVEGVVGGSGSGVLPGVVEGVVEGSGLAFGLVEGIVGGSGSGVLSGSVEDVVEGSGLGSGGLSEGAFERVSCEDVVVRGSELDRVRKVVLLGAEGGSSGVLEGQPDLGVKVDFPVVERACLSPAGATTESNRLDRPEHAGKGKVCRLCGDRVAGKMKRHVLKKHLPWFFEPMQACWSCRQYEGNYAFILASHRDHLEESYFGDHQVIPWLTAMSGFLWALAARLGHQSLDGLLAVAVEKELFEKGSVELTVARRQLLHVLSVFLGCPMAPGDFQVGPPNHVVCLCQISVVRPMLEWLGPETAKEFSETFVCCGPSGVPLLESDFTVLCAEGMSEPIGFNDSHCHLVHLLGKLKVCSIYNVPNPEGGVRPKMLVNNLVFQSCWAAAEQYSLGTTVYHTVGVHPLSVRFVTRGELKGLVSKFSAVAIGECGLDSSRLVGDQIPLRLALQEKQLREQLEVAKELALPVVLHLRGPSGDVCGLERVVRLAFTAVADVLADTHPIHWHCFMGSREQVEEYGSRFKNLYFGVTWKSLSAPGVDYIPLESVLFESDAPFLVPDGQMTNDGRGSLNTFYNVRTVVQRFSRRRNLPAKVVGRIGNANCEKFYGPQQL